MRSFQGKLRLADRPAESMGAGIEVAAGSLSLIVSDQAIAAWPLERVEIEVETDGFHFVVDGEEFIFVTKDASELAEAVGLFEREQQAQTKTLKRPEPRTSKPKPVRKPRERVAKPARTRPRWSFPMLGLPALDFKSRQTQVGVAAGVAAAVLGVVARPLLAFAMMGAGSLGLLFGTGALVDPIMATRLPAELSAGRAILISVVLLLVGMLVLVL